MGIGVSWVAAFLDSFSEGKPKLRCLEFRVVFFSKIMDGFLERNQDSNSVSVWKSEALDRGLLGAVRGWQGIAPANLS